MSERALEVLRFFYEKLEENCEFHRIFQTIEEDCSFEDWEKYPEIFVITKNSYLVNGHLLGAIYEASKKDDVYRIKEIHEWVIRNCGGWRCLFDLIYPIMDLLHEDNTKEEIEQEIKWQRRMRETFGKELWKEYVDKCFGTKGIKNFIDELPENYTDYKEQLKELFVLE